MTRFKLIPWLAIPALLLLGPVMPTATAAIPQESVQDQDGLIFFPLDDMARTESVARLGTSAAGQVTVAQYGTPDGALANRGRFLAVRFELPYAGSYTITGLTFPSRTQAANPANLASFRSVRILGHSCSTGLPDKSQTLFRTNRYRGSSTGADNTIPLSLVVTNPTILYAVFDFPAPTSGVADTFPFLLTDRLFTEKGLFAERFRARHQRRGGHSRAAGHASRDGIAGRPELERLVEHPAHESGADERPVRLRVQSAGCSGGVRLHASRERAVRWAARSQG